MKFFWHFFTSNIKYNKLELAISYGLTALVFGVFFYFQGTPHKELFNGETLISVAFYALLYAFFSNKKKFNLKYLVSLPLPKGKLLMVKSSADVVFFAPAMALAFVGAKYSKIGVDSVALVILLAQAALLVSFFLFDSDIEQPRLENTRASFVNRLVYVRKMVDSGFLMLVGGFVATAIYVSPASMALKQYLLILCFSFVVAFKFRKSLRLMQDESLSYFIFKRDALKMGWKLGVACVPAVVAFAVGVGNLVPSPYGEQDIFRLIKGKNTDQLAMYLESNREDALQMRGKNGYSPALAAVQEGSVEALELLLENGFKLSWESQIVDKRYFGYLPPHLAAISNNPAMMDKVLSLNEQSMDLPLEESMDTPLILAAKNCHNEMVDFLLEKGANANAQNEKGESALIASIKKGCDASTALLLGNGANVELRDKKGKFALDYMGKRDGLYYLVKRKMPRRFQGNRGLASEGK